MPDAPIQTRTVFVSHAHADNELCDRYVEALRARKLDVWYDRSNLKDGLSLSEQIAAELERRTAFVVLLTPMSLESFWVRLETQAYLTLLAQDPSRLLLPVRMAECKVPIFLQTFKYVDAVQMGFGGAIAALAEALHAPASGLHSQPSARDTKTVDARTLLASLGAKRIAMPVTIGEVNTILMRGYGLDCMGKPKEALAAYEQALEIDPTNGKAWMLKGHVLRSLGREAEADAALRRARELGEWSSW